MQEEKKDDLPSNVKITLDFKYNLLFCQVKDLWPVT